MPLSMDEIKKVLNSELILDAIEIVLIQQIEEDPVTYKGPGSIFIDKNGLLRLKMYHGYRNAEESTLDLKRVFGGTEIFPGKLIESKHYYSLEAVDLAGRTWREKNIWISGNISLPASGRVIETQLRKITYFEDTSDKRELVPSRIHAIFPGNFRLPFNRIEKTELMTSLSICELNFPQGSCALKKRDGHAEMEASFSSGLDSEKYSELLFEALSIGIGKFLQPLVFIVKGGPAAKSSIFSRKRSDKPEELPSPFPIRNPHDSIFLNTFVSQYLATVTLSRTPLFGYWLRVLGMASGEVENRALVLTTSIEGIVKTYYPKFGLPDNDFMRQISHAIDEVQAGTMEERIKERTLSSLRNAKLASPKGALFELAASDIVRKQLVKKWVWLRNKAAHADELSQTDSEIQKFIDEIYGCLELFYALILNHISYVGEAFEYSKEGWPTQVRPARV